MNLFLSWSGERSHALAKAIREFLPNVLEGLKVFISSEGIHSGVEWFGHLRKALDDTDFGILCRASRR
jgi:hypothetical protein